MRYQLFLLLFIFSVKSFANNPIANDPDTLTNTKQPKYLVFPFFLKSPETSLGFGLAGAHFFKAKKHVASDRTSDISLIGLYTLRKQVVIAFNSTVYFRGENEILRAQVSNSYYPDRFWGIGNATLNEAKENYAYRQYFVNPQFLFRIKHKFYLGINADYQRVYDLDYLAGGAFDKEQILGRAGSRVAGLGALATWDTRNSAYSPDAGSFAEISSTVYSSSILGDYRFTVHTFDIRDYRSVSHSTVIASQAYLRISSGDVPIRNLSLLGGSDLMRGYWKGRFADENLFALQTEVRQFLFWRLGVVAFSGVAQVADKVHYFGLADFHWACGAGLRIMVQKKDKLNLRIDYGFGENSSGLYVILKEAF